MVLERVLVSIFFGKGEVYMTTASIIIIGDEILSGKFRDENTPWLIDRCAELHIKVQSIQIIPDEIERIASTVREESKRSRYVFTTGGVGPTHDDLTFLGVATAFGQKLKRNEVLAGLIKAWFKNPTEDAYLMAMIPEHSRLIPTTDRMFPQVVVENVYVFPGVPKLLKRKFNQCAGELEGKVVYRDKIGFMANETDIAGVLREIQEKNLDVSLGSYPRYGERPSLQLTIDAYDEARVQEVRALLHAAFRELYFEN